MSLFSFLKVFGSYVKKAIGYAHTCGLTDTIVKLAYVWVKEAADKILTNAEKRAFVVKMLTDRGISESIARLAVEQSRC